MLFNWSLRIDQGWNCVFEGGVSGDMYPMIVVITEILVEMAVNFGATPISGTL